MTLLSVYYSWFSFLANTIALELMRKKIEMSTERIRVAKLKEEQARKVLEEATKTLKEEEAAKQKLCDDLNQLVQESSNSQFLRLEELKRRLEALNPSRGSTSDPHAGIAVIPAQNSPIPDASSKPCTTETTAGVANNPLNQENVSVINGQNHQNPSIDGEGRGKKRSLIQGRGRGIGAFPKGRGPPAGGWTGAGFDVDGRN